MNFPEKLRIGYNKREYYEKPLAYVTYYKKNEIAQEGSFKSWIDKDIPCDDHPNEALSGFQLRLTIADRMTHDYFEVIDPRGFIVQIPADNVCQLIKTCSIDVGGVINGTLLYGWENAGVRLADVNSTEYKQKDRFKKKEKLAIGDLEVGCLYYMGKRKGMWVYLGEFTAYDHGVDLGEKNLVFYDERFHRIIDHDCEIVKRIKNKVGRAKEMYDAGLKCLKKNQRYYPVPKNRMVLHDLTDQDFEYLQKEQFNTILVYTECSGKRELLHYAFRHMEHLYCTYTNTPYWCHMPAGVIIRYIKSKGIKKVELIPIEEKDETSN